MPQWALLRPADDFDPNDPNHYGDPNFANPCNVEGWLDLDSCSAWVDVYESDGDDTYTLIEEAREANIVALNKTYQLYMYRVEWEEANLPDDGMLDIHVSLESEDSSWALDANACAPVGRDLLFRTTYKPVCIDNGIVRDNRVDPNYLGGFADCHGRCAETHTNAIFTAGMVELLEQRGDEFTSQEKSKILDLVQNGLDYLVDLAFYAADPNYCPLNMSLESGQFQPEDPFVSEGAAPDLYGNARDRQGTMGVLYGTKILWESDDPNHQASALDALKVCGECYTYQMDRFGHVSWDEANEVLVPDPNVYDPNDPADPNKNDPNMGFVCAQLAMLASRFYMIAEAVDPNVWDDADVWGDPNVYGDPSNARSIDELRAHVLFFSTWASRVLPSLMTNEETLLARWWGSKGNEGGAPFRTLDGIIYAIRNFNDPNTCPGLDPNDVQLWKDCCGEIASGLFARRYAENGFGIITHARRDRDEDWAPSDGGLCGSPWHPDPNSMFGPSCPLGFAATALRLTEVVDDPNLLFSAVAHIQWAAGLNRGCRVNVSAPASEHDDPNTYYPWDYDLLNDPNMVAASCLYPMGTRFMIPWKHDFGFDDPNYAAATFGGQYYAFSPPFPWYYAYAYGQPSETWIPRDGLWLRAMAFSRRYALTVLYDPDDLVSVTIEPDLPSYHPGAVVTLSGEASSGDVEWAIYDDPNDIGDSDAAVVDTNATTTLVMDSDKWVEAKPCGDCGGSLVLALVLCTGYFAVMMTRRRA